jgi:hypothetical protein
MHNVINFANGVPLWVLITVVVIAGLYLLYRRYR